ncbi:unnamed protein product [Closterium sp. NIES-54]
MKLVNEIVINTGKNITKPQKALTNVVRSVVSAVNVLKKAGLFRGGAYVKPKKSDLNATADMAAFRAIQAQEIKEVLAMLSPSKAFASTSASISESGFSSSSSSGSGAGSGAGSNSSFNSGADYNSNSGSDFNSSSSSGSGSGPGSSPSSTNRLKTTTSVASLSSSRTGLRRAKPAAPEPCNGWICIDISITGIILALKAFYLALEGFIQGSIQGSIQAFIQIAAFLGAAFEAFFFALFNCKGATTMLFPMDALVWAGALTVLSGSQLADVANYNMLDGLYPYDIMQGAGWMARFQTQLPDQTVTKVFGQGSPMVVLMGRLGIPSVVLWPNFYVGRSLIVHIVSTSLVPTLSS